MSNFTWNSSGISTFPGLIDIHVHFRDPGQTYKEDFYTGTLSALAGGFTTVLDMPNNKEPITTSDRLNKKIQIAKEKIVSDIGFYFGSLGNNLDEFDKVYKNVFGIKLYLDMTTGGFIIDEKVLEKIYNAWNVDLPVLLHSEEESIESVLKVVKRVQKRTHFCHVSSRYELQKIIEAKELGLPITCGVTPHHLFLTVDDIKSLHGFAMMKPPLRSKKDREYLWNRINYIDVIESDHAPHTLKEKQSKKPSFGVPGLETTLPLLLKAENEGKISIEKVLDLCYTQPAKIMKIQTDDLTKVEIDLDKDYVIDSKISKTKCTWTPFDGWNARGKIKRVFIRGKKVLEDGELLVKPGFGKVIKPSLTN